MTSPTSSPTGSPASKRALPQDTPQTPPKRPRIEGVESAAARTLQFSLSSSSAAIPLAVAAVSQQEPDFFSQIFGPPQSHGSSQGRRPPPTPVSRNRINRAENNASPEAAALLNAMKAKRAELTSNGAKLLGSGNFSDAYLIENRVIKVYQERTESKAGVIGTKLPNYILSMFRNQIHNYEATWRHIPCAALLNSETAEADGCTIWEYVPGIIDPENQAHMDQVKKMFKTAFDQKLDVDLQFGNVRARENGTVVLIDHHEETHDEDEWQATLDMMIKTFTDKSTLSKSYFDPRIKN